jgi:Protein of unknown function (DUF3102)
MTAPAKSASEIAKTIRRLRERSCKDVIEIGRLLAKARDLLDYGDWYRWLETEFQWSRPTADNFIRVFETFGDSTSLTVSVLEPSALYALSQRSTPPTALAVVEKLVKAGKPPSAAGVKRIIREIKFPACDDPPPVPSEPTPSPSVREAALAEQFRDAVTALVKLAARPSKTFAGVVPANDLDMVANFLKQVASKEKAS